MYEVNGELRVIRSPVRTPKSKFLERLREHLVLIIGR